MGFAKLAGKLGGSRLADATDQVKGCQGHPEEVFLLRQSVMDEAVKEGVSRFGRGAH